MAKTDIARRVYNHTWKLDPIVRSLLDTDFYKLLMLQMIWGMYPKVDATFSLINRTTSVRLAEAAAEIESEVGIPVTSSNHAMAWHAVRLAGIQDSLPQFGKLFTFPIA